MTLTPSIKVQQQQVSMHQIPLNITRVVNNLRVFSQKEISHYSLPSDNEGHFTPLLAQHSGSQPWLLVGITEKALRMRIARPHPQRV